MHSTRRNAAIVAAMSTILDKFSISVFLPALPLLTQALDGSRVLGQHSVALYAVGVALSQLVWGYLSDIWGRRTVLLILAPIYIAGCAITALSTQMSQALVGLLLQGFGVGAMFSVTQALVGASFGERQSVKALAYIAMTVTWASAIGSMIGGWLVHHFSWESSFVFLALCALLIAPLYLLVSETPQDRDGPISVQKVAGDYLRVARQGEYLKYVLTVALLNAGLFVFYTVSPFLIIRDLGLSAGHYGMLMMVPLTGFMIGRYICGRLAERVAGDTLILSGNVIAVVGAAAMVVSTATLGLDPWTVMFPMAVYLIGMGVTAPAARAQAMHTNVILMGTAASLLSVAVNAFAAANSFLASHLDDSVMPLYILTVGVLNLALFVFLAHRGQALRDA